MNKKIKQSILIASVSGLLTGPLLAISAVLLDMMDVRFSVLHPVLISLLISGTYLLRHLASTTTNAKVRAFLATAVLFFALFSYVSLGYTLDFLAIGPKGEYLPMLYLLKVKYEGMNIVSEGYWERSQWNFCRPECYSEMYAARLKNHSLVVAGFYYGDFKTYPLHSFLKSAYRKLFCRKDSKMAYDGYKKLLTSSGFSITEGLNSFTARNESLVIYCRLDGKNIMVARAEKAEEMLLNAVLNSV